MTASETPDRPYSSIALVDLSALFAQYWFGHLNKSGEQAPAFAVRDTMAQLERIDRSVRHTVVCLDAPPYVRATVYRLICDDVRIIGCDKDLFQLVGGPVRVLRPAKGEEPEVLLDGPAIFKKTGGITPPMIVDWLALMGDPGDNIPGCPSVGEKRATIILGNYGSLEKLYWAIEHQAVETNKTIGKAIVAKLVEFKAQVFQARELVRLRPDAPVDANELLFKGKAKPVVAKHTAPLPDDDDTEDFDAAVRRMPESGWPNPRRQDESKLLDPTGAIPSGSSPAAANAEMADEADELGG